MVKGAKFLSRLLNASCSDVITVQFRDKRPMDMQHTHVFCINAKLWTSLKSAFLKLAFAFVMHYLMLHCFRFVFPTLGNYTYNRYKIKSKLSLLRIESRIEFRETENKRFTQDWFLNNFTQTYSCNTTRYGLFTQVTVCSKQDQFKL